MSPRLTLATAERVLRQLRHDRRTVVLMLVVPGLLLVLLRFVFDGQDRLFDVLGLQLVAILPFVVMFLVASIATLRERTSGTLERLLTTPLGKGDLLLGYGLAFGLVATAQSLVTAGLALGPLGVDAPVAAGWVVLVALLDGLLGTALGLFLSAFARSEFQVVQFMPAVIGPQLFLCGLFVARDEMQSALEAVSSALPLTWAVAAMGELSRGATGEALAADLGLVTAFVVASLALGAATLRRRTA